MAPHPNKPRRLDSSRGFIAAGLALIALLFFLRLPYLLQAPLRSDSDLSVVGLMAAHIAQGRHFPAYLYGQGYLGAGEAYLAALLFKIWGRSLAVQSLASLTFFALFAWLNAALIRKYATARQGLAVLLISALAPPAMAWWFCSGFGGYCAVLAFGAACLWIWNSLVDGRAGRTWPLIAGGAVLAGAGLWTYPVMWLFLLPCLGLSLLTAESSVDRVCRSHPADKRNARLKLLALAFLGLGLVDLVHTLAVGLGGWSYSWMAAGIHLTSPFPATALSRFLPRSLGLVATGLFLLLVFRVGLAGLRLIWDKARAHLIWLLICLAGWVLSRLIYVWGEQAMASYAPIRIWAPLGINGWAGITERWSWLGRFFVPKAFFTGVPFLDDWAAWVLFAPIPLAIVWIGMEAGRALAQGGWNEWLEQNRLDLVYALSAAGLLVAALLTPAAVNETGYRYLLLLIAWWPFLLVRSTVRLARISKPLGAAFLALPLALLLISTGAALTGPGAWTHVPDRAVYASLEKLMARAGVKHGLADYWVAYNATNLTHERLIISPDPEYRTGLVRYLPYARAVAEAPRKAYVFRRAYDYKVLERLRKKFKAERRYFTWWENRDWILLTVQGQGQSKG